jgi:hypothetical protein
MDRSAVAWQQFSLPLQVIPQAPQFGELVNDLQAPSQQLSFSPKHVLPHVPQFCSSLVRSTQVPLQGERWRDA